MKNAFFPSTPASAVQEIQQHWGLFLALGIAISVLGIIALVAAGASTLLSVVFYGALLLVAGIAQLARAFSGRHGSGFLLDLLTGLLYGVVGWLMMVRPGAGAVSITLLLSAFFVVGGLFRSSAAIALHHRGWGWMLCSGALTFVLGLMILNQWPTSSLWVIGMFVGIDLLFYGWSLATLSLTLHGLGRGTSLGEPRLPARS